MVRPSFWFGPNPALSLSKALKLSDISIVTTLWKVSLLFLVAFAFVFLGETPSPLGLAGILLSVVGVYLLNVQKSRFSIWAPLRELLLDRGLSYSLVAAAFYAPAVVLIKQIILHSDPYSARASWLICPPHLPCCP